MYIKTTCYFSDKSINDFKIYFFSYCSIAMCICFSQKAIFHWNMVLVSIGGTTNLLYANGHSITMIKELYH